MTTALELYTKRGVAQERKRIHESSDFIYPIREKSKGKHIPRKQTIGSFGTTSYSVDFAKKEGKPAIPRPCSVTRRNRPHPSQVQIFECPQVESSILSFILEIEVLPFGIAIFCPSLLPQSRWRIQQFVIMLINDGVTMILTLMLIFFLTFLELLKLENSFKSDATTEK